jgi:hypothetical protein
VFHQEGRAPVYQGNCKKECSSGNAIADESNAWILEQGLIEIAKTEEIVETAPSVHGIKYIVDGLITAPFSHIHPLSTPLPSPF